MVSSLGVNLIECQGWLSGGNKKWDFLSFSLFSLPSLSLHFYSSSASPIDWLMVVKTPSKSAPSDQLSFHVVRELPPHKTLTGHTQGTHLLIDCAFLLSCWLYRFPARNVNICYFAFPFSMCAYASGLHNGCQLFPLWSRHNVQRGK